MVKNNFQLNDLVKLKTTLDNKLVVRIGRISSIYLNNQRNLVVYDVSCNRNMKFTVTEAELTSLSKIESEFDFYDKTSSLLLVECVNTDNDNKLTLFEKYYLSKLSIWKDNKGNEYGLIYKLDDRAYRVSNEMCLGFYNLKNFKAYFRYLLNKDEEINNIGDYINSDVSILLEDLREFCNYNEKNSTIAILLNIIVSKIDHSNDFKEYYIRMGKDKKLFLEKSFISE